MGGVAVMIQEFVYVILSYNKKDSKYAVKYAREWHYITLCIVDLSLHQHLSLLDSLRSVIHFTVNYSDS